MTALREPTFVYDQAGNRIAAVLDIESYYQLLDMYEDAEDIRLAEEARLEDPVGLPFDEAVREIERLAAEYDQ